MFFELTRRSIKQLRHLDMLTPILRKTDRVIFQLSELEVTHCFAPDIFHGLASVAIATKLEKLVLTNCGIGKESMEAFLEKMSKGTTPVEFERDL